MVNKYLVIIGIVLVTGISLYYLFPEYLSQDTTIVVKSNVDWNLIAYYTDTGTNQNTYLMKSGFGNYSVTIKSDVYKLNINRVESLFTYSIQPTIINPNLKIEIIKGGKTIWSKETSTGTLSFDKTVIENENQGKIIKTKIEDFTQFQSVGTSTYQISSSKINWIYSDQNNNYYLKMDYGKGFFTSINQQFEFTINRLDTSIILLGLTDNDQRKIPFDYTGDALYISAAASKNINKFKLTFTNYNTKKVLFENNENLELNFNQRYICIIIRGIYQGRDASECRLLIYTYPYRFQSMQMPIIDSGIFLFGDSTPYQYLYIAENLGGGFTVSNSVNQGTIENLLFR